MGCMDWVIIAPHCDDAELGMGGYIARDGEKWHMHLGVMCVSDITMSSGVAVSRSSRIKEQGLAMDVLGIDFLHVNDHGEENGLLEVPRVQLISFVERLIDKVRPTEVFIPLPSFNQDHVATYEACVTALRPTGKFIVPRVWAYEYPGNLHAPQQFPAWGKCLVKLSASDMRKKVRALKCHKSQFTGRAHPLIDLQGVDALARLRGAEAGVEFAEAFYLLREVY